MKIGMKQKKNEDERRRMKKNEEERRQKKKKEGITFHDYASCLLLCFFF